MKIAADTNILIYAEGEDGTRKQAVAQALLERLVGLDLVLPAQVLGEFYSVQVRKIGRSPEDAQRRMLEWMSSTEVAETSAETLHKATALSIAHRVNFWDALVVASAEEAGCRLLLSEDMHSGFTWQGVTIVNPFAAAVHPLLEAVLG